MAEHLVAEPIPLPELPPMRDADDPGLDVGRYLAVLRRSAPLIAGLVVAITVVTAIDGLRMPPRYRAEALLLVEPRDPRVVDIQGIASEAVEDETRYLRTQYQMLKSRALAEQVIRDNGLRQDPELGGRPAGPDTDWSRLDPALVDRYLAGIDVEAVPGTRLIKVSYTAGDPAFAARMANAHVEGYVRQGLRNRTATNQAGLAFLQARLGELKQRLQSSEMALNEYRWSHGLLATDEKKENVVVERLGELNQELSRAEAERLALEAEVKTIDEQGVEALPEIVKNTTFHELHVQLAVADSEWARVAAQFKPNYPGVIELKRKADMLRQHLESEVQRVADAVRNAYRAAKDKEERLRTAFAEQKSQALAQKDAGVEYAILQREVDTNRTLYDSTLQRMKEMTVAVEARASNVSVADRAVPPSGPLGTGPMRRMGLAVLLAALAGVVIAFVRDALQDAVRSADELERAVHLPTLGVVPRVAEHAPALLTDARAPAQLEAYRHVRTSVMLSRHGRPLHTILVASAGDGEGKTTTAVNLAVALSQVASRVLLIDADLRRRRLHGLLGVTDAPGLSEVLNWKCKLDEALRPIDERLFVLPAGSPAPNPTELLGTSEMQVLLDEVADQFEYVVIDSPAAFAAADAIVLATQVDGVALVARADATSRRTLRRLRARFRQARAPLLGIVLNAAEDGTAPYGTAGMPIDTTPPPAGRSQRAA